MEYRMVGMKRAVELWLLGLGKWEETVLNAILKSILLLCFHENHNWN